MAIIQFNSLDDAFKYRTHCPLCNFALRLSRKCSSTDDLLTIDNLGDIIYINKYTGCFAISNGFLNDSSLKGQSIIGLDVDCCNCAKYYYTIAIYLDMTERVFEFARLNTEFLAIEEEHELHEIRNIYSMNKTIYSYYLGANDGKTCEVPLIPLDVYNPSETLLRLKKLIMFL